MELFATSHVFSHFRNELQFYLLTNLSLKAATSIFQQGMGLFHQWNNFRLTCTTAHNWICVQGTQTAPWSSRKDDWSGTHVHCKAEESLWSNVAEMVSRSCKKPQKQSVHRGRQYISNSACLAIRNKHSLYRGLQYDFGNTRLIKLAAAAFIRVCYTSNHIALDVTYKCGLGIYHPEDFLNFSEVSHTRGLPLLSALVVTPNHFGIPEQRNLLWAREYRNSVSGDCPRAFAAIFVYHRRLRVQ